MSGGKNAFCKIIIPQLTNKRGEAFTICKNKGITHGKRNRG